VQCVASTLTDVDADCYVRIGTSNLTGVEKEMASGPSGSDRLSWLARASWGGSPAPAEPLPVHNDRPRSRPTATIGLRRRTMPAEVSGPHRASDARRAQEAADPIQLD
jgi:hypothetical protein